MSPDHEENMARLQGLIQDPIKPLQDPAKAQVQQPSLAQPENPFSAYIRQEEARRERELNPTPDDINESISRSVFQAFQHDPQVTADMNRFAAELGIPVQSAIKDPNVTRRAYEQMVVREADLARNHPVLAKMMQDYNFAAQVRDDLDNLIYHDDTFSYVKRQVMSGFQQLERGLYGQQWALSEDGNLSDVTKARIASVDRALNLAESERGGFGQFLNTIGQMLGTLPVTIGAGVAGSAATPLVGAATAWTATVLQTGYTQMGNAYIDMRNRGVPHDVAIVGAFGSGLAEGILEATAEQALAAPLKAIIAAKAAAKVSGALTKKSVMQALRTFTVDTIKGTSGELGTEMLQTISERMADTWADQRAGFDIKKMVELEEGRGKLADALAETIIQTVEGIGPLAVFLPMVRFAHDTKTAKAASRTTNALDMISKGKADSLLKQRNLGEYEKMLAEQAKASGATHVHVEGEVAQAVLQQLNVIKLAQNAQENGLTPEQMQQNLGTTGPVTAELEAAIPGITEQIKKAAETKTSVAIPLSEFIAKIDNTEVFQALKPHIRLDPNGMSAAETAMFNAEGRDEILAKAKEAITKNKEAASQIEAEQKEVRDAVYKQLKEAGTMSAEQARDNATLFAALVVSGAELEGVSPKVWYEQNKVAIEGVARGGNRSAAATALSELTRQEEARQARLQQETGEEFYHGSGGEIKIDEWHYNPENIYGQGFYSTNNKNVALSYNKKNVKAAKRENRPAAVTVYKVIEKAAVKFYDLDIPVSDELKAILESVANKGYQSVRDALRELEEKPNMSMAQIMDAIRAHSQYNFEDLETVQDAFEYIQTELEKQGYGGYTHVGGILTKSDIKHKVKIYWHPATQLELSKVEEAGGRSVRLEQNKAEADADESESLISDDEERIQQGVVPTSVDDVCTLEAAFQVAQQKWPTGRDLKVELQERIKRASEAAGVDVSKPSDSTHAYLVRVAMRDAIYALKQNQNAVGWYDLKTRQALALMALKYPEIATDENARFAMVWAMAVTSNGLKVDKNFELAAEVYRQYSETGKMPSDIGIGTAKKAINKSLALFNDMVEEVGMDNLRLFMQTNYTVGEIGALFGKRLKPTGEFVATIVRGAAILGPKIGNGFFSNLYGEFGALTMDRWLIRTWGRWTGTLLKEQKNNTINAENRLRAAVDALSTDALEKLNALIGLNLKEASNADLAKAIKKASEKPENREAINKVEDGEEIRKAGNRLYSYYDGQKEAPSGPQERIDIRSVFSEVLRQLQQSEEYRDLTMADLQAVLWYAEKRLYETAKEQKKDTEQEEVEPKKKGKKGKTKKKAAKASEEGDTDEVEGYSDTEAPDYANAAAAVVRDAGVPEDQIQKALQKEVDDGRARRNQTPDEAGATRFEAEIRGFTKEQKKKFSSTIAVWRTRRAAADSQTESGPYSRRVAGLDGLPRLLTGNHGEFSSKQKLQFVAKWEASKSVKDSFKRSGLNAPHVFELEQGNKTNAEFFRQRIAASKATNQYGASVYVYSAQEYAEMRLFISSDNKAGFAIKKNGDIVSVFSEGKSKNGDAMMHVATQAGGRKLDCFRTVLPDFYGRHGFRVVSSIKWNDAVAPEGWDKNVFKKFNNGEPDVVFMVYDPEYYGEYEKETEDPATTFGSTEADYNSAVQAQDVAVSVLAAGQRTPVLRMQQFAGEGSQTLSQHSLKQAKELLANGTPARDVWQETGWFVGPDGKWRYEISDKSATWHGRLGKPKNFGQLYTAAENYEFSFSADMQVEAKQLRYQIDQHNKAMDSLIAKWDGSHDPSESFENIVTGKAKKTYAEYIQEADFWLLAQRYVALNEAVQKLSDDFFSLNKALPFLKRVNKKMYLSDLIAHDSLFAAYPHLAEVEVYAGYDMPPTQHGAYMREGRGKIYINPLLSFEESFQTLLHEVQHAIQDFEGFAGGGNAEMVAEPENLAKLKESRPDVAKEFRRRLFLTLQVVEDRYYSEVKRAEKAADPKRELAYVNSRIYLDALNIAAHQWYLDLTGEIEARDVAERVRNPWDKAIPAILRTPPAEQVTILWDGRGMPNSATPANLNSNYEAKSLNQGLKGEFVAIGDKLSILLYQGENGADITTFLHEANHYFVFSLFRRAAKGTATAEQMDMVNKLLKWWGIPSFEAWNSMTAEAQAPHMEALAYNFEIYMFEGRAPSIELQSVFRRIKAWIRSVYKNLVATLNERYRANFGKDLPAMNGEIRQVFDRMLATQDQIDRAEVIRKMVPAWQTQEESGMDDAQWAAYQKEKDDARQAAYEALQADSLGNMEWLSGARGRVLKELQKQHEAVRSAVEAEVTERIKALPVYRALRWGAGVDEDGLPQTKLRRISIEGAKQVLPPEGGAKESDKSISLSPEFAAAYKALGTGRHGILGENGYDPDEVAAWFGFNSGREMLIELTNAKPIEDAIREETDRIMTEKYSELSDPKNRDEAVDAALHNDVRSRMIAIELKHLDLILRRMADSSNPEAKRVREAAEKEVADLRKEYEQKSEEFSRLMREQKDNPEVVRLRGDRGILQDKLRVAENSRDDQEIQYLKGQIKDINRQIVKAAGGNLETMQDELRQLRNKIARVERVANAPFTSVRMLLAGVQQASKLAVGMQKIKELNYRKHQIEESRAAQKTISHIKNKETQAAWDAKQRQLLHHHLAKEALAAQRQIKSFIKKLSRFFKADSEIAKTRDMVYVEAARAVISMFGLGPRSVSETKAAISKLEQYHPELYEKIRDILDSAEAEKKDYKELTVDQFFELQQAINGLWKQARDSKIIQTQEGQLATDAAVDELVKRQKEIGVPETPGQKSALTKWQRIVRGWSSIKAMVRRVEHWAHTTDGGKVGAFTKYIWQPIKQALNEYREARNIYVKKYLDLLSKVDMKPGKIEAHEFGYTFGVGNGGLGKAELLGALLHIGNLSNMRKLLLGRGWATETNGVLNTSRWDMFFDRMVNEGWITKEDMDFVQAVWDLNEELKPMAQRAHRKMFGYAFKEIEPKAVQTKWGVYRGGYVPAKTDPLTSRDAAKNAKMDALSGDFRQAMPSAPSGWRHEREEAYLRPLSLDVRLMAKHIDEVIRFAKVQPAIKDVTKILRDNRFKDTMDAMDPMAIEEMLLPWLNRAARQISETPGLSGYLDQFWRTVRRNVGIDRMFMNVSNALQQITGLSITATKVQGRYIKASFAAYLGKHREFADDIAALSKFMKDRLENQMINMRQEMDDILLNPSKWDKIKDYSQKRAYVLQAGMQNMVDLISWNAAYNQSLAEDSAGLSPEEAQAKAVEFADSVVRMTQSSLSPEDVAAYEASTPFMRTLTQFSNYFNMLANLNAGAFVNIIRDMGGAKKNVGKMLHQYLLGFAIPAIISEAITRTFAGKWDDDDDDGYSDEMMDWLFGSQMRTTFAMVPGFGQGLQAFANSFNDQPWDDRLTTSPSVSAMESATVGVVRAVRNLWDEDKNVTGKNVRDVITGLSLAFGVPLSSFAKPVVYGVDVASGRTKPTAWWDWGRGLMTGISSEASLGK